MVEQFEGKLINISGDRKTLKAQNKESSKTFRSFNPINKEFSPSDYVKISYYIKEFNDKKFNNIRSMEIVKEDIPETPNKTETKIDYKISENKESKEKIASMLISYSKDLYIALLENNKQVSLTSVVDDILTEYDRILKNL